MSHSYDKRFNAHISVADGQAGVSVYADSIEELHLIEDRYKAQDSAMAIRFVDEGYADREYITEYFGEDPSVQITRRTDRSVPRSEWERTA